MNIDNKTTREQALEWFNSKASLEKTRLCDTNTEIVGKVRRWETLTGREIELIYLSEHPTETESKGQEPEVDLLVDAARYFDCKKINIPGIYSGSYIDKIDFFVFADRLTKENKELREALEMVYKRLHIFGESNVWEDEDEMALHRAQKALTQ